MGKGGIAVFRYFLHCNGCWVGVFVQWLCICFVMQHECSEKGWWLEKRCRPPIGLDCALQSVDVVIILLDYGEWREEISVGKYRKFLNKSSIKGGTFKFLSLRIAASMLANPTDIPSSDRCGRGCLTSCVRTGPHRWPEKWDVVPYIA